MATPCDGNREEVITLTADHDAVAARGSTATGNLPAPEVACRAFYRNVAVASLQVSRKEAALTNLPNEVEDCFGASSLFCSTIGSAVYSQPGSFMSTLYEACCGNIMFLWGNWDCNVDIAMAVVHPRLSRLCSSFHAGRTCTQLSSVTSPQESY